MMFGKVLVSALDSEDVASATSGHARSCDSNGGDKIALGDNIVTVAGDKTAAGMLDHDLLTELYETVFGNRNHAGCKSGLLLELLLNDLEAVVGLLGKEFSEFDGCGVLIFAPVAKLGFGVCGTATELLRCEHHLAESNPRNACIH